MVMGACGVTFCFAVRLPAIFNVDCSSYGALWIQKGPVCVSFTRISEQRSITVVMERFFIGTSRRGLRAGDLRLAS